MIKAKIKCIETEKLRTLTELSHFVNEVANIVPDPHQPFVGQSAFAHKGGMHVSAVSKDSRTFEHIKPESVGNRQRIVISELAGRRTIIKKADEFGVDLSGESVATVDRGS
jgi:2-isopropylmalate synthase